MSTVFALAVLLYLAGITTAAFLFNQTGTMTSGPNPITGPASLTNSSVAACNSLCPGVLLTQGSKAAVTFTGVSSVLVAYSYDNLAPSSVYLVPHSANACGTSAPVGAIGIQYSTQGAIKVSSIGYDYCVYFPQIPQNSTFNLFFNYQVG